MMHDPSGNSANDDEVLPWDRLYAPDRSVSPGDDLDPAPIAVRTRGRGPGQSPLADREPGHGDLILRRALRPRQLPGLGIDVEEAQPAHLSSRLVRHPQAEPLARLVPADVVVGDRIVGHDA